MSLRVWLPLTKDTKNQGLMELPTPWAVWSKNEGGKIGQYCYSDCAIYHKEEEWLDNKWSLSCWVKSSNWGMYNDILMCKNTSESTQSQFYFSIIGGTRLNLGTNGGSKGVSYNYTFSTNTWYHITATYDGTIACLYINGEKVKTQSYPTAKLNGMNNFCIGCRSSNAAGTSAICNASKKFNDVRVYDHALSPLEVKHIAQGLILHYPLNRNGWGQENNIAVSKVANRSCTNFTYDPSTQEWTMTCPAASSVWGYGIAINDRNIKWAINQTWVISMEVYVPHSITWNCDINNKPDLTDISEYTGNDYDVAGQRLVCTNGIKGSKTLQAGWNKIWFSQTANTTYGLTNYSTNWGIQTTNESSDIDIKIRKIKGEVIASGLPIQPTSWCPNSSDALATTMGLNDNIEYDTSGYENNGAKVGTFSYDSDTPKYDVSTKFTTEPNAISFASNFSHLTTFTYSCWIKTNVSQSALLLMGYQYGNNTSGSLALVGTQGGFHYYAHAGASSDVTIKGSVNCCDNQWHMITATYDGYKVITYIDGIKDAEGTVTLLTTARTFSLNYPSGASGRYFNGLLSDARVYATALSAEDVKDLYELGATIDTNGVLSTYEFTEQ